MPVFWLVLILLALSVAGFFLGRQRALASVGGNSKILHSLPNYYGHNVALSGLVPALGILVIWLLAQPFFIDGRVSGLIPDSVIPESSSRGLVMSDVRRVAEGLDIVVASGGMTPAEVRALDAETTDVRAELGKLGL